MTEKIQCTFKLCKVRVVSAQENAFDVSLLGATLHTFYQSAGAANRIHGDGQQDIAERQLIDHVSTSGGITQGVVYDWEKGAHAQEIHIPREGQHVELTPAEAHLRNEDSVAEWRKGFAFFAVKGEYIAYCLKNSSDKLLTETLRDALCRQLGYTVSVELMQLPALDLTDEVCNKIESFSVCPSVEVEQGRNGRWKFIKKTKDALGSLLGDTGHQFTEDISDELVVEVKFKPRNKNHFSGESRRMLAKIAERFKDFPKMKIYLKDGRALTADRLRISEKMNIVGSHRIPRTDILLIQLSAWLHRNLPSNANI